eukprot:14182698-Ditylum_brightwellii.AAC.1
MTNPFPRAGRSLMYERQSCPEFNYIDDSLNGDESSDSDSDVFVFLVNEDKSAVSSIGDMSMLEDYQERGSTTLFGVKRKENCNSNNILTPRSNDERFIQNNKENYSVSKHDESFGKDEIYDDERTSVSA